MGKNDPPIRPPPHKQHSSSSTEVNFKDKYQTEYIPRERAQARSKFGTAPVEKQQQHGGEDLIKAQSDYIRNHLRIKSGVDRHKAISFSQAKKVSIRNYTPKTIHQQINMGMWI